MKEKLRKINEYEWELDRNARPKMNVKAKIIANKKLLDAIEDAAVEQLTNVACLPGVVEPVIGLPDMHWGYGLPMGAVGAFDAENGIISSGLEVPKLRQDLGDNFAVVTPGIRPGKNIPEDDQKRIATPNQAIQNGADYLVIGRPISRSKNPVDTVKTIQEDINNALSKPDF